MKFATIKPLIRCFLMTNTVSYPSAAGALWLRSITKVRISIGASSTTSFVGSTGPPLGTSCESLGASTFHFNLFFSISSLSWFADKLISLILFIYNKKITEMVDSSETCFPNYSQELDGRSMHIVLPFSSGTISSVLHSPWRTNPYPHQSSKSNSLTQKGWTWRN